MDERKLIEIFIEFLSTSEFPQDSILRQPPVVNVNGTPTRADLLILDPKNNEYVGLIEFIDTSDTRTKDIARKEILDYLDVVGLSLIPVFLIIRTDDDGFKIFQLSNLKSWSEISKSDFPSFSKLVSMRQIEEKQEGRKLENEKLSNELLKRRKAKQVSIWSFFSVVVGIVVSLISVFAIQQQFSSKSYLKASPNYAYLSLEIKKLQDELHKLSYDSSVSTVIDTIIHINTTNTFKGLNNRLKVIENGISNNPEKTLSIVDIRNEISLLKQSINNINELEKERISSINERISILNALILGITLAIFSSVLGLMLTYARNINPLTKKK